MHGDETEAQGRLRFNQNNTFGIFLIEAFVYYLMYLFYQLANNNNTCARRMSISSLT